MTPEEFLETVRADNETALSRLGSSKALYADTNGEMERETVLAAAADAERAAHETFAGWAADESNDVAREAFETTAAEEDDHYATVTDHLDDHEPGDSVPAIHEYLRSLDGTIERAGGFVGRTVASAKSKEQMTGYFVGDADPQTASVFRGFGDDIDAQRERGLDLLDALGETDEDWERARTAATEAIQAAYEEYTDRLESMGVNPKPVC